MKTRSYSDLIAKLEAIKSAADGADTSMPEDPSGDGTLDPQTGSQYSQYSKDIKNIDTVPPNAEDQPRASMSEDHEQENSFSSYTLSTAGSPEQSAKGEYTDRADDPGTSMPAEAGQEKYSAFNCTLEENIDVFEKCAQALIQTSQQYNQAVKQAAQPELITDKPVGGQPCDDHNENRDGAGDQEAVQISVFEIRTVPGSKVIVHGKGISQRQGERVGHDQPFLAEGIQDDPDKGIDGCQGPEAEYQIGEGHGSPFFSVFHGCLLKYPLTA